MCCEDRFQCIGIVARVEHFGGYGHRCRSKVLNLFQFVSHLSGEVSQFCHIALCTPRVTGDEIWDELLAQTFFLIDAVEDTLEFVKLLE